ncbi:myelin-associated glycoprotein-like [Trichomycterus rosablanca]|uniref:myelin-associated glycoprotein-like n=1 Tax=Trichomycterus rosablanca TaxID=2290929 RepID=UPI002F3505A2
MDPQSHLFFCLLCLQVGFTPVFTSWSAEVEPKMDALVKSCVVLPCHFNYPDPKLPDSRIRGIWHKKDKTWTVIYHQDHTQIVDSFKGRTKLIGHLGEKNCSLEINDVQNHDSSPFCFRAEIPDLDKYSFVDSCTSLNIKPNAEKPEMFHEESFEEGTIVFSKCFVRHTCPSHHPVLTWNRRGSKIHESHKNNGHGVWEVESVITFTSAEEDDHTDITCTATFQGGMETETTRKIFIKRGTKIHHIVIPVAAVLGTAILFGGVCFYMTKRYRRQIEELQSRDGVWSRLSRMSRRFRSVE